MAYIGEIKIFGGTYAPENWFLCDGSKYSQQTYAELFSLIGTAFGGDESHFCVPNLQYRFPAGVGPVPGFQSVGATGGAAQVNVTETNLPPHTHYFYAQNSNAASTSPANNFLAIPGSDTGTGGAFVQSQGYILGSPNTQLNSNSVSNKGVQNVVMQTMSPYIALNYIICWNGIYPSRS